MAAVHVDTSPNTPWHARVCYSATTSSHMKPSLLPGSVLFCSRRGIYSGSGLGRASNGRAGKRKEMGSRLDQHKAKNALTF